MKYSIIVPVYKEKNNIPQLIKSVSYELNKHQIKFELIIIDDDSNDGSIEEYNKSKNINSKFIIRKKKPRDLSKSVLLGIKISKFDNIIVMDGDLQHNPIEIIKLINLFIKSKNDLVIASRKFDKLRTSLSFTRIIASKTLIVLFNFMFNLKVVDPMSGFFIVKKKIIKKNEKKLFKKGYKILADILTVDKKIKYSELFINFKKRKFNKSKMNLRILIILIQFLIKRLFQKI